MLFKNSIWSCDLLLLLSHWPGHVTAEGPLLFLNERLQSLHHKKNKKFLTDGKTLINSKGNLESVSSSITLYYTCLRLC